MLARTVVIAPDFVTAKLIAFLIFTSHTLTGHPLSCDAIFMAMAMLDHVVFSMVYLCPVALAYLAELKTSLERLKVIRTIVGVMSCEITMLSMLDYIFSNVIRCILFYFFFN